MSQNRHAFLVMAHKNLGQLKILLSLLDHPRTDIYLHVDQRAAGFNEAHLSCCLKHSSLYLLPRKRVVWGSRDQIRCEFRLMEAALQGEYSYYHLLSGQDLPIKPMEEILAFFDECGGREFVSFRSRKISRKEYERLSLFWWPRLYLSFPKLSKALCDLQRLLGVDRLKGKGITLYKGANWFSCTHAYVSALVRDQKRILRLFSFSHCGDEVFLQTHLMATPFRERLYDDSFSNACRANMRLVDWNRGDPYVFRTSDLDELRQSEMLFARKFDESLCPEIIRFLSEKTEFHPVGHFQAKKL